MAKGLSIHIGLNHVDPAQYEGWDGALNACVADAKDMHALAKKRGFKAPSATCSSNAGSKPNLSSWTTAPPIGRLKFSAVWRRRTRGCM